MKNYLKCTIYSCEELCQWRGIGTEVYYQSPIEYNPDLRFNAFQIPYIIDITTPFIYFGVDTGSSVIRCGLEMNNDSSHYFKVWVGIDNDINQPPYRIMFWVAVIGI